MGKRELTVVRVAGQVADVGDVVRLVGQHELRDFAAEHQPLVKRGVAGVTRREALVAKDPDVARMLDRRIEPLWRRRLAESEVLIVVEEH